VKSLRTRLLVGLLTSSTLVLAAHGFGIYTVVRARLVGELDRALIDTVRSNAPEIARESLMRSQGRVFGSTPGGRRTLGQRGLGRDGAPPRQGDPDRVDHPPENSTIPSPVERDDLLFGVHARDGEALLASLSLDGGSLLRLGEGLGAVSFDKISADTARFSQLTLPTTGQPGRAVGIVLQLDVPEALTDRVATRLRPPPTRPPPLEIVMAIDASQVANTLVQLRWLLVLGWLAASAVSALVIVWLLKISLAPVAALRQQIEAFDESHPSAHFAVPETPSELMPIVDQLNSLVERMATALTREQEFAGHAAHELRTPLAGLRSTLEVALSRPRDTAAHVASAEQCLEITLQMQQMVDVLLHLARATAPDQHTTCAEIEFAPLISASWAPWAERAREQQISLTVNSEKHASLPGDAGRLGLLLTNLLGNAVDHGDVGGIVEVSLKPAGKLLRLTVSNPASEATAITAERAFDAFWRGDSARHETALHSGLGLTLCRRLATSLGGELRARQQAGQFTVTLTLPLDPRNESP
jgi:signal transduction histidine kinase